MSANSQTYLLGGGDPELPPHLEKEATLEVEVKGRFGILPNFFRLTPERAEITDKLW